MIRDIEFSCPQYFHGGFRLVEVRQIRGHAARGVHVQENGDIVHEPLWIPLLRAEATQTLGIETVTRFDDVRDFCLGRMQ